MPMSVASSNANNGLFVCNIQITLFIAMLIVELMPEVTPRTYLSEEPGTLDPSKQQPTPHISKPKFHKPNDTTPEIFKPEDNNTNVNGLVGTKSILNCHTGNIFNITVEWIKYDSNNKSKTILTRNNETLSSDKRFLAEKSENSRFWSLHIRFATKFDEGLYECRVCNEPTFSIFAVLNLYVKDEQGILMRNDLEDYLVLNTEARASILDSDVREVERGFPIRLSCIINFPDGSPKEVKIKPRYMFWYRDNRVINYDLKDGAVVHEGYFATELIFQRALPVAARGSKKWGGQNSMAARGEEFRTQNAYRNCPNTFSVIVFFLVITKVYLGI